GRLRTHTNHVRLEWMAASRRLARRSEMGESGQRLGVAMRERAATRQHARKLAELLDADRGLEIRHPVVEADLRIGLELDGGAAVAVEIGERHPVLAQQAQARGQGAVASGDHAALARRDALARMKAEAGQDAVGLADRDAVVERAGGAGGVLDEEEPML